MTRWRKVPLQVGSASASGQGQGPQGPQEQHPAAPGKAAAHSVWVLNVSDARLWA